jgi:hypothetical protein
MAAYTKAGGAFDPKKIATQISMEHGSATVTFVKKDLGARHVGNTYTSYRIDVATGRIVTAYADQ